MRISTRGEYGLRAMLDLAQHYGAGPIALKQIAERQQLSEHYLEQLMGGLRKAGLVTSVRGAQGGYRLAAEPEAMIVGDILRVLEGSVEIRMNHERQLGGSPRYLPMYATRYLWRELNERVAVVLDSLSLADLLAQAEKEQAARSEYVYHI